MESASRCCDAGGGGHGVVAWWRASLGDMTLEHVSIGGTAQQKTSRNQDATFRLC